MQMPKILNLNSAFQIIGKKNLKKMLNCNGCKQKECKELTHVIFDLDGTLLDSEGIYFQIFQTLLKRCGKVFTEELAIKIKGRTELEGCQILVNETNLPITAAELSRQLREEAPKFFLNLDLMPGAERLVKHFRAHKVPMAIATSSTKDSYDLKTAKLQDFFKLMNHIVTGGSDPEVKHGKPAPDIYLVCASRFPDKPKPANILVFEDAMTGYMAATTARMKTILIPDPKNDPVHFKNVETVLKSLNDFRPELYGFPPFAN